MSIDEQDKVIDTLWERTRLVQAELFTLVRAIKAKSTKEGPTWGDCGDLAHVLATLKELNRFMGA